MVLKIEISGNQFHENINNKHKRYVEVTIIFNHHFHKVGFTILILTLINLQKLVCKVDQLVKRRAKSGLIRVKVDWNSAKEFVTEHLDKEIKV